MNEWTSKIRKCRMVVKSAMRGINISIIPFLP
jgi:hypothetical protein